MPTSKNKSKSSESNIIKMLEKILNHLHNNVLAMNQSKFFAGLMIITLNIASRFVNIKLSKTVESYLKHTFSRDALIFAIIWMGTRDIYIALCMTLLFIILVDFVFNEDSMFCCLPEQFTEYHVGLLEEKKNFLSPEEIKKVEDVLQKAKTINKSLDQGIYN